MSVFWKGRSEIRLAKLFPSSAGIKEAKLDKYWLALPSWITSSSQCFNNFFGRSTSSPFSHSRRNVKASDGNIQGILNISKVSWDPPWMTKKCLSRFCLFSILLCLYPIQAERRTREAQRWKNNKMYPPKENPDPSIPSYALQAKGRLWPSTYKMFDVRIFL